MEKKDLFTFSGKGIPSSARVVSFRGTEALSRLYRFEIELYLDGDDSRDFDMGDAVGGEGSLNMSGDEGQFTYSGIVASVELMNEFLKYALYRVVLVPSLWKTTLTRHSRVFVDTTMKDLIEKILKEGGVSKVEMNVSGASRKMEHVCQYQESDFDFVSRWMELLGIYYYFRQAEGGETLVLSDSKTYPSDRSKPVRYFPLQGVDESEGAALETLTCTRQVLPASVHFKDYDYNKPSLDVSGEATVKEGGGGPLHYYGENVLTPDEAKQLATVRAEAYAAQQQVFRGTGKVFNLRAGHTFKLEEHPRSAFNDDYLITSIEHHGNQSADKASAPYVMYDDPYRINIVAIPGKTQYRPERKTPIPRVNSLVHGVVDAEGGDPYAEIDEQGRYKIKIHFDESESPPAKASTWVRMLQPHGGAVEGFHFPLRKGTEVLILFLGGDPDRPVIAGIVPNPQKPSPVTKTNNTQNVIQTGGLNRFEMEDTKGKEYTYVSTPPEKTFLYMGTPREAHNLIAKTEGDGLIYTGRNLDVEVLGDKTEHVVGDVTERYDSNQDTTVRRDVTETYEGNQTTTISGNQTTTVETDQITLVEGNRTTTVEGDQKSAITGTETTQVTGAVTHTFESTKTTTVTDVVTETYQSDQTTDVTGNVTRTVGGDVTDTVTGNVTQSVTGNVTETVTGNVTESVTGNTTITITGTKTETVSGSASDTVAGDEEGMVVGTSSTITAGASSSIRMAADSEIFMGAKMSIQMGLFLEIAISFKLVLAAAPVLQFSVLSLIIGAQDLQTWNDKLINAGMTLVI